ncbi:uncharacterized protein TNCV_3503761 [Trichonephila clavipes]|uniref:DUF5641 domain-containing protein n=1 Tax=Trichonephila clavipes TaxID=2585209 RepID=A0A8X6VDV1_TRICX|nr:uncharacterized protein TNCV_3503761 [Trichonephila clavipes]
MSGTMVIVKEDFTPVCNWLLGRVVEVYHGSDATRGLLATDHVILNHGQVTWTTPELAPPLLTTTPYQREDVSALDRFNVHRCPTRRVFSGTGLELVTRQATIRYLCHSASAATSESAELRCPPQVFLHTPRATECKNKGVVSTSSSGFLRKNKNT